MILVTGGAGFIGSNLVAALCERGGAPVHICDRIDSPDKSRNIVKHHDGEVIAPESLMSWLADNGAGLDAIFHLGASSSTLERDAKLVLDTNLDLSMRLWRWCAEARVRFYYASSAATYGDGQAGFDDDNALAALSRLSPLNLYGWSKHVFDVQAVMLAAAGVAPLQWAGLKFFNVYGPNEFHKGGQQSLVVQLHRQIRKTGRVRLFRSHNPAYADGGQERDFIWVGDCIDVMLWLYDNADVGGIFNVGTGVARSFADLAQACFAALGQAPEIHYIDTPEEIRRHYQYHTRAVMDRLRRAGYDRAPTSLEAGVQRTIGDYLETNDPYR